MSSESTATAEEAAAAKEAEEYNAKVTAESIADAARKLTPKIRERVLESLDREVKMTRTFLEQLVTLNASSKLSDPEIAVEFVNRFLEHAGAVEKAREELEAILNSGG